MNRESRWLRMDEGDYLRLSGRADVRVRLRWNPLSGLAEAHRTNIRAPTDESHFWIP